MDEKLRLNKNTGYYEVTYTLKVESEIFQRAFYRYVEENTIDLSDPDAVQSAIQAVSDVSRWMLHPRAEKSYTPPVVASAKPVEKEKIKKERSYNWGGHRVGAGRKAKEQASSETLVAVTDAVNGTRFK